MSEEFFSGDKNILNNPDLQVLLSSDVIDVTGTIIDDRLTVSGYDKFLTELTRARLDD